MDQVVPKPRKAQILHAYSKKVWKLRILPTYKAQVASQRLECLRRGKTPPRSNIHLKSIVTQEKWNEETPEFREAIRLEVEGKYAKAMQEYEEAFKNIPKSGKEYDWYVPVLQTVRYSSHGNRTVTPPICRAIDQSYAVLQPLIDLVAMKYGTVATLWMAGPQGAKAEINCVRCVLCDNWVDRKTNLRIPFCLAFIPAIPSVQILRSGPRPTSTVTRRPSRAS